MHFTTMAFGNLSCQDL